MDKKEKEKPIGYQNKKDENQAHAKRKKENQPWRRRRWPSVAWRKKGFQKDRRPVRIEDHLTAVAHFYLFLAEFLEKALSFFQQTRIMVIITEKASKMSLNMACQLH